MGTISSQLRLPPLRRQSMAQLIAKAKDMGMPPEDYARQLVEDGLALQREAESMTLAEIVAPVRRNSGPVDEAEIVKLVDQARSARHRAKARAK